jgi:hypothetical protein
VSLKWHIGSFIYEVLIEVRSRRSTCRGLFAKPSPESAHSTKTAGYQALDFDHSFMHQPPNAADGAFPRPDQSLIFGKRRYGRHKP